MRSDVIFNDRASMNIPVVIVDEYEVVTCGQLRAECRRYSATYGTCVHVMYDGEARLIDATDLTRQGNEVWVPGWGRRYTHFGRHFDEILEDMLAEHGDLGPAIDPDDEILIREAIDEADNAGVLVAC